MCTAHWFITHSKRFEEAREAFLSQQIDSKLLSESVCTIDADKSKLFGTMRENWNSIMLFVQFDHLMHPKQCCEQSIEEIDGSIRNARRRRVMNWLPSLVGWPMTFAFDKRLVRIYVSLYVLAHMQVGCRFASGTVIIKISTEKLFMFFRLTCRCVKKSREENEKRIHWSKHSA